MPDAAAILTQAAQALARGERAEVLRLCRTLPRHGAAQRLLALLAYQDDDFAAAAMLARKALASGDGVAHQVLGAALLKLGQPGPAVPHFRAALAQGGGARTEYNLAMALLAAGDWAEGWQRFEARWRVKPTTPWVKPWERMWDGGDPAGRHILAHAEQGFGDTLQFVRYLPQLAGRGARVTLAAQPQLARLLTGLPGVTVITRGDDMPRWDAHVPLMSLPRLFATTPDTVPPPCPPPVAAAALPGAAPRIGLVWAGNRRDPEDRLRSLSPDALAALLARLPRDATVISLQHDGEGDLDGLPEAARVHRLGHGLRDFADTAAVMAGLDLMITVDTAAAHLAGTLGTPVWLLLQRGPDWRWLAAGETTPWYPSMRLFRQAAPGDWGGVIERVAEALP